MSGANQPELLSDEAAQAFAAAQFADEEPTDVEKLPTPEDGDQPPLPDVLVEYGTQED